MTLDTLQPFEQSFTVLQNDQENAANFLYTSSPSSAEANNYLLETFHQYPHGEFRPTFYNPFEIKHRHRTSRDQLKILEKSFSENSKPSATIRRILAQKLEMTPRGVQIWFQNRRAKAKLLRRRSFIQNQSSDENEDKEEEVQGFNLKNCNKSKDQENVSRHNQSLSSTTDINQSSVLFSQFFTNQHPMEHYEGVRDIVPSSAPQQQRARSNNWPVWQQQSVISENVRTVATAAAAAAVANSASSPLYESPLSPSYGGSPTWLNMSSNFPQNLMEDTCHNSLSARRQSCPVPMMMTNMNYVHGQPQLSYLSPAWSPSAVARNRNNCSPLMSSFKRQLSYDSVLQSRPNYQEINGQHQQLTPPLTASCSASTVAGSPMSLDVLYNDPVALSHNGFYGVHNTHSLQHVSLPFSANVTDIMPNFT